MAAPNLPSQIPQERRRTSGRRGGRRGLARNGGGSPTAADAELAGLQRQRRILLKGGVVLTLDRQVGDFAQADVLIEDGKIREVRPNIAVSATPPRWSMRRTASSFPASSTRTATPIRASCATSCPTACSIPTTIATSRHVDAGLSAGRRLCRDAGDGARHDRHGHDRVVDISQVSHTPEHSDACIRALQESGIRAVFAYSRRHGAGRAISAGYRPAAADLFQLEGPAADAGAGRQPRCQDVRARARGRRADRPAPAQRAAATQRREKLLELARAGLLRPGDEYIHCLHLNDETWRLIKDTGGHVSLCPRST